MDQQNFALGTVGWDSDPTFYDLGSPGTDKALVRVTLVWGRNPAQVLTGAGAQGMKIVATLPGPIYHMPNLGDLVELAIPQGMERMPGAATIRGWHKPTPQGFSAANAMWPIDDGKFAIIGDSNAVAAALSNLVDQAVQNIISGFNSHTHPYTWTGMAGSSITSPPSATIANQQSTAAKKVKLT